MKNLLLTLVVALFATSFAFSQTGAGTSGTGTANVTVIHANMWVAANGNIEESFEVYPNSTSAEYGFSWNFYGSPGLNWLITETGWTGEGSGLTVVDKTPSALTGTFPTGAPGDLTTGSWFTYFFKVACAPGTAAGLQTLTYAWTVAYN